MNINPYLNFNGDCREAFERYADAFGGTIDTMDTWGKSPMCDDVSADWHDKIMHATLSVDGALIMGSDAPPGHYEKPQGTGIALNFDDANEAEKVFHALAEDGTVTMPLAETFWASRFGMVTDKHGIPWMINCE